MNRFISKGKSSHLKAVFLKSTELQQLSCHGRTCWVGRATQLLAESSKGPHNHQPFPTMWLKPCLQHMQTPEKEKEEMGWIWALVIHGHVSMQQGGVSGHLGIRMARMSFYSNSTGLLCAMHACLCTSLILKNYIFWLPLKHRVQKQMILPVVSSVTPINKFHPHALGH